MGNMYYGDGTNKRLLSGIAQVPRLTLAQYQALTVKPRFWVRTDAPETYNQLITWDDQAILGSKNIIKYPYAYGGGSTHGLTVTVNADGSITASGQPDQAIGWVMITNIITEYNLQVGDKLIFSEHEVNNSNASAALTYVNPASSLSLVQGDYELTVTSEMVTKGVSFILWFNNGVNLSTPVTFKPMVRLTSCSDSTWASPALTNRKLTELTTYLSETKVKQLEAGIDGKVSKSGDTMTGGLIINRQNANSELELGNSTNSRGVIILYSNNDKYSVLRAPTGATSISNIYLPDQAGTIALTSDVPLIENITSLFSYNTTYNVWATAQNAVAKSGYRFLGFQALATNTNSPAVPACSFQDGYARIRNWDANYTFIATAFYVKN